MDKDNVIAILGTVIIFGIFLMMVGALLEDNRIVKDVEQNGYVVLNKNYYKIVPVEVEKNFTVEEIEE